ncbi:MAG: hypothetical protein ABR613_08610 [Actinomycetota bacterium]
MSSQPPETPPDEDAPPRATRWPRWRISMLVGALLLLAASIVDAAVKDLPRFVYVVAFFTGYVFLAYGFFLAMAARNRTK